MFRDAGQGLGWVRGIGFSVVAGYFVGVWAEDIGMAPFEEPAKHGAGLSGYHIEGDIEELDFGGGLDGPQFGVSLEVLSVGVVGNGLALEGDLNGDAFGDAFGDAMDEFDCDLGFGTGFHRLFVFFRLAVAPEMDYFS